MLNEAHPTLLVSVVACGAITLRLTFRPSRCTRGLRARRIRRSRSPFCSSMQVMPPRSMIRPSGCGMRVPQACLPPPDSQKTRETPNPDESRDRHWLLWHRQAIPLRLQGCRPRPPRSVSRIQPARLHARLAMPRRARRVRSPMRTSCPNSTPLAPEGCCNNKSSPSPHPPPIRGAAASPPPVLEPRRSRRQAERSPTDQATMQTTCSALGSSSPRLEFRCRSRSRRLPPSKITTS